MITIRMQVEWNVTRRYPLFRYRIALFIVGAALLAFSVVTAALFSSDITRPAWIVCAILPAFSAVLCLAEFAAHSKQRRPGSGPENPKNNYHEGPEMAGGVAVSSGLEPQSPRPHEDTDATEYEEVVPADQPNDTQSEQARLVQPTYTGNGPFLPPAPSESEKSSSDSEVSSISAYALQRFTPLRANKLIVLCDWSLAISYFTLYVTTFVVESLPTSYYWRGKGGYFAKVHASLALLIMTAIHVRCFIAGVKAIKDQKKKRSGKKNGSGGSRGTSVGTGPRSLRVGEQMSTTSKMMETKGSMTIDELRRYIQQLGEEYQKM